MKKILSILLILFSAMLLTAGIFSVELFTGYEVIENVSYGTEGRETMDLYIPKKPRGDGAVLFIHGGSWQGGDKKEETLRARYLAARGYVSATMNYTLYDRENPNGYSVDLVMAEIDLALEKIVALASEMGIAITSAATSGYSAGAHLSMLYAFSRRDTAPVEIKFHASLAGPADFGTDVWGDEVSYRLGEMLSGREITAEMIGSGEADAILAALSPVTYVDGDTPPSLFVYGGRDTTVSAKNGDSLVRAFEKCSGEYEYIFMPDSDHRLIHNLIKHGKYMLRLSDYCETYFE